ncbi:hypothetical protein BDW75DRAFT_223476 [Aspergillus navahoensis]
MVSIFYKIEEKTIKENMAIKNMFGAKSVAEYKVKFLLGLLVLAVRTLHFCLPAFSILNACRFTNKRLLLLRKYGTRNLNKAINCRGKLHT